MNVFSEIFFKHKIYAETLNTNTTTNRMLVVGTAGEVGERTFGSIIYKNDTDYISSITANFPSLFNVGSSTITPSSNTLNVSLKTQNKNLIFASPNGLNGTPDFRSLVVEDIPTLPSTHVGITSTNINNWNTAYGWGDHASAGYLTATTAPVNALVTSTSATGVTNVVTTNTNTYLNIVRGGTSTGSSTQITGAGSVTVSSDANGKLTITGVNTTYGVETLVNLNTGTSTTGLLQSAKNLNDWLNGKGYATTSQLSGYIPTSHAVNGITSTNINNWNTAYGWGNHASAGYLKLADISNLVPYTGANKAVDLNTQRLLTNGVISTTNGTNVINLVSKIVANNQSTNSIVFEIKGSGGGRLMGTYSFELFRYMGISYKFNITSYIYNNNWYSPRITWVSGNSSEISSFNLIKKSDSEFYIEIIFTSSFNYMTAKVDWLGYQSALNGEFNLYIGSEVDLSASTISATILPSQFTRDSYLWDKGNFNPAQYVLQTSLNTQLANYVPINGVTTINNTKTFTSSPIVPNATLDGHAVNLGQLNILLGNNELNSIVFNNSTNNPTNSYNNLDADLTLNSSRLFFTSGVNTPINAGFLDTTVYSNGAFQMAQGDLDNFYFRRRFGGNWQPWNQVASREWVQSFGLGRKGGVVEADLNLITTTSVHNTGYITLNSPRSYGSVWTHRRSVNEYTQMYVDVIDASFYLRGNTTSNNTGWIKMASVSYVQNLYKAGSHLDLTGTTFSLKPTLNSWISDSADNQRMYFGSANSTDFIMKLSTNSGDFAFRNASNDVITKINGTGLTVNTGGITINNGISTNNGFERILGSITGGWDRKVLTTKISSVIDSLGYFGSDSTMIFGYIGLNYNNNIINWTPDKKVGINLNSADIPSANLHVRGNMLLESGVFNGFEVKRASTAGSSILYSNTNGNLGKIGFSQNGDLYITKGYSSDSASDLLLINATTGLPRFSGLSGTGTRITSIGTDGTLSAVTPTIDYILGAGNSTSKNIKFTGEGSIISVANASKLNMLVHQKYITGVSTGILCIKHASVSSATMFDATIKIYGCNSKYLGEFRLSFYQQTATAISSTGGISGYYITSTNFPTNLVRVGFDADGLISIMIGDITTAWSSYLSYTLERVETKHTGYNSTSWENGWTSEMVTDITGYTSIATIPMKDIGSDTTYTSGNGLTLSGTTFGQTITTSGSGTFVTGITQTTNGFQVNLGTPPNTTYSAGTLALLTAGTNTNNYLWSAKNISDFTDGKYALISPNQSTTIDLKLDSLWDYSKWVIPLFEYTGDVSTSTTNWVNLTILCNRHNGTGGTHGVVRIVGGDNLWSTIPRVYIESIYGGNVIEPVTFTYNGKTYFGIRSTNPAQNLSFIIKGDISNKTNSILNSLTVPIVYQQTSSNTVVNTEINDSLLVYSSTSVNQIWGNTISKNNITASGLIKSDSSDSYVLLGGGGHKLVSDFSQITTRLRSNTNPYVSGDLTLLAGANTTITQSGANITIASTDTNTTYSAGNGLTLSGTAFSLPITDSGSGDYVTNVVANANGLTVSKSILPVNSLVTSSSATGTSNVATTNTNTFLNIVRNGSSAGSSTQVTGAGSVTVASDANGKLTINGTNTNTTYTSSNGILLTGTNFTPSYGTTVGTIAQGNDTRINNGQTAFGWGRGIRIDGNSEGVHNLISLDANLVKNSSVWINSGSPNMPNYGANKGAPIVNFTPYKSGSTEFGFSISARENRILFNTNEASVVGNWLELYHTGNFNPSDYALTSQLAGYVPTSRTITAGNGLSGGGSLDSNRTIALGTPTAITLSSTNSVTTSSHTHEFKPGGTTAQYIRGDGSLATYVNTTYTAGNGLTLSGTTFSLPVTDSGSGNYVSNVVASANGLTVTKATLPIPALVTSTSATGATNVVTTNTNTYLNVTQNGASPGSSTQVTGAGSVTVSSDANGKLTITGVNTTYTAGNGLMLSETTFSVPVRQSGSGNVVSAVTQTTNGITVTKGITAMETSHLANLIDQNLSKVASPTFNSIELSATAPFIDFHYNKSSADYTSRIIEESLGSLNLISKDSLRYKVDGIAEPFLEIDRYNAILGADVPEFESVALKTTFGSLDLDDEGLNYRPKDKYYTFGILANVNAHYDMNLDGKLNDLKIKGRGSLGSPTNLLTGNNLSTYLFADVSNKDALGTFRVDNTISKNGVPVFSEWGASLLVQSDDTMFTLNANPFDPEIYVSGGGNGNNVTWNKKLAFSTNEFSIKATAFYEGSLRKLKENIKTFNKSGIELINSLDIVTFDRIDDKTKNKIGIIADDTSEEFLSEDKDAVDLYKTSFIQAKAIQELSDEVVKLKDINDSLEERLKKIEKLLNL